MKTSKKIIVIVLSVLIVLTSVAAYASSFLRLGVANPKVYSSFLPTFNAYDSMYESFTNYLLEPIQNMDVPEELQGVPEDLVAIGIPKKEFNKKVGEAIGGGLGWLIYNHEDVEVPLKYFAQNMKETIANDERVINSETNIKATMDAIVAAKIESWVPTDEYEQNFRGYVYNMLSSGNQTIMDKLDYWMDVYFYYYGFRLSVVTIVSFVLLIVLIAAMLIITKEDRSIPLKLAKVLCIVYGALNILIAVVLFLVPVLAGSIGRLAEYAEYIGYAQGVINSFGILALVYGLVLIIIGFAAGTLQKKIEKAA